MRYALAAIALTAATSAANAAPTAEQLIKAFAVANSDCRGSAVPDDISTRMECDRRSRIVGRLSQLGWCYGKKGQVGADFRWHRCAPGSNAVNDLQEGPED